MNWYILFKIFISKQNQESAKDAIEWGLLGDVIRAGSLADVANIWAGLPLNSDRQPHTPEY